MYAYNNSILFSHKNLQKNWELELCSTWLVDNILSIHLVKTQCVLLEPNKHKDFNIKFNRLIIIECEIGSNKYWPQIIWYSINIYIQKSSSYTCTVSEGSDELLPLLDIWGLSVNFWHILLNYVANFNNILCQ